MIILGTVQLGLSYGINNSKGKPSQEDAFSILDEAKLSGINILDTAAAYGTSESLIGDYHQSNDPFSIITKFHHSEDLAVSEIIERALEKLKVETISVMMFHSFSDFSKYPSDLSDLMTEKEKGKIESIGVSVYTNLEIEGLLDVPEVDVIQVPFNMFDNDFQRGKLLRKAKKRGKIIHTRSVFLQGLFFKDLVSISGNLKSIIPELELLKRIQEEAKIPMHQLALTYTLSQPYIDKVLIGVENVEQLKNNVENLKYDLPKDVFEEINRIKVSDATLLNPSIWKL